MNILEGTISTAIYNKVLEEAIPKEDKHLMRLPFQVYLFIYVHLCNASFFSEHIRAVSKKLTGEMGENKDSSSLKAVHCCFARKLEGQGIRIYACN